MYNSAWLLNIDSNVEFLVFYDGGLEPDLSGRDRDIIPVPRDHLRDHLHGQSVRDQSLHDQSHHGLQTIKYNEH